MTAELGNAGLLPAVVPFSRELIRDFLDMKGLKYLRDKDEDFLVIFRREEIKSELRVWFIANGPQECIYTIVCFASAPRGDDLLHWYKICNDWNKSRRWPKASASRVDDSSRLTLTLEQHLDLEAGIHKALFDDYTQITLSAITEFFGWLTSDASDVNDNRDDTAAPGASRKRSTTKTATRRRHTTISAGSASSH